MHIVGAGVHNTFLDAVRIDLFDLACVWQNRLLLDWLSVQLGAQEHSWSVTVLENAHDAVTAYSTQDFIVELLEAVGDEPGGPFLLAGQIRVLMEVLVNPGVLFKIGKVFLDDPAPSIG
jgi:hypothetical protein